MAYTAAQVALFEQPDDYVIENNPKVTYTKVLDKFDSNLFQDEERHYRAGIREVDDECARHYEIERQIIGGL